jgi:hypothetical protein
VPPLGLRWQRRRRTCRKKSKKLVHFKCRQSQQTHRSWHRQWLWWRKRNFEKSNTKPKKKFYFYLYKKKFYGSIFANLVKLDFPALGPKLKLHLNKIPGVSQTNPFAGLGVSQNNLITGLGSRSYSCLGSLTSR